MNDAPEIESKRYAVAWQRLRLLSILATATAGPAFIYLICCLLNSRHVDRSIMPLFIVPVIFLVLRHEFRCPRCGQTYFHGRFGQSFSARKCIHCSIPRNWIPTSANDNATKESS